MRSIKPSKFTGNPKDEVQKSLKTIQTSLSCLCALVALGNGIMLCTDGLSVRWPVTDGKITSSESQYDFCQSIKYTTSYKAHVTFDFSVNKQPYTAYTDFSGFSQEKDAREKAASFKQGATALVHYLAFAPWFATISPGSGIGSYVKGMLMFALFAVSLAVIPFSYFAKVRPINGPR